jgi:hypothetical protein
VKNSRGKILGKTVEKFGAEKTWINDLEEVKGVEKFQCGNLVEKYYISSCDYFCAS